jgi:hypothetical protein
LEVENGNRAFRSKNNRRKLPLPAFMGGSFAPRSVEEGADRAVWLALEADHGLTGKFFRDGIEIDW